MIAPLFGRHYETGTLVNALAAMGVRNPKTGEPYSEALALGASGGIAFGHFVFEYKGHLPHVALLPRNTFSPFERMLDNLGIRREVRETTDAARAERNLRQELDRGNVVLVWADVFSMPYRGLDREQMWSMQPVVVLGQEGDDFLLADGASVPVRVTATELSEARARVKKDRFRMAILETPDPERLAEGVRSGIQTCVSLFLEKPPAGSANNFGIAGMRHWSKMLAEKKNAKSWTRTFEPGPRLVQALAGCHGQPGVWDWIETWGTGTGADRDTYADFLLEVGKSDAAGPLRQSADRWRALADASLPDEIPEFRSLKDLKRRHQALWISQGRASDAERASIREEMRALISSAGESARLVEIAPAILEDLSWRAAEIADIEESAIRKLATA